MLKGVSELEAPKLISYSTDQRHQAWLRISSGLRLWGLLGFLLTALVSAVYMVFMRPFPYSAIVAVIIAGLIFINAFHMIKVSLNRYKWHR